MLQIKARRTQLAEWETLDNGKPITEAEGDIVRCSTLSCCCRALAARSWLCLQDDCAACFEYYAGLADQLEESRHKDIDVGDASYRTHTRWVLLLAQAPS